MSKQTAFFNSRIDRRKFMGMAGGMIASAKVQGMHAETGVPTINPAISSGTKPNFLFIIADDLTYRTIHAINNEEIHTPHLDKLVRDGCHFTHCFHQGSWAGAVCVASRTMLMTGLTTFHAQAAVHSPDQALQIPVWGQTLREHGYRTFVTGKWHLDAVSLQRAFSEQGPVAPGFLDSTPDMYDRPAPDNHWNPTNRSLKGHWLDLALWDQSSRGRIKHSSEIYADAAIDFLTAPGTSRDPFFMYVGFNAPHDPRQAPQEYLDLYPLDGVRVPPNFLPEHPFDLGEIKGRDEILAPFPRTEFDIRTHRREYYAIISHMDTQIGRILSALEYSGKARDTIVIFTADHGLSVGEHGLMGKQNQYDCSIRIPLIMRGPGIQPGKRIDELVYQHCMYATTCELANIPIPTHVEFPSLAKMLFDDHPQPLYEAVFSWYKTYQRSIRTPQHKMIRYVQLDRYQLFDMEKDPWEIHDVIADPVYSAIKDDLSGHLEKLQHELNDPLFSKETISTSST